MEFKTTEQWIEEGVILYEIKDDVMKTCPYDGAPIIRNRNLTIARCMHPECKGHMKYKADDLLKYLGVKGVGPEKCLSYIRAYNMRSHFEIIPHVFTEEKPSLHLWEIAMFCYIPGISKNWEEILAGYGSFKDYFENAYVPEDIKIFRNRLESAEKFFTVKPPLAKTKIEVMITGSINGYSNREQFIADCNAVAGHLIRIKLCGKKLSADYLITENKQNILAALKEGRRVTEKAEAAWRGGAKIVTSQEFLNDLRDMVASILGINE